MADRKAIFDEGDLKPSKKTQDVSNILERQPECLQCGKTRQYMKCCTRCHSAYYCSRDCFVNHWSDHKKICKPGIRSQIDTSWLEAEAAKGDRTFYKVQTAISENLATQAVVTFEKASQKLTLGEDGPISAVSDYTIEKLPSKEVQLRYNKQKRKFKVADAWDGETIYSNIAAFLSCLDQNMKLIHKGKKLTKDSVRSVVASGAVFQVVAEKMEDAEGLLPRDIEVLMQQTGVERNVAVKALRNSNGDLIDAIMNIGNR